MVKLEDQVDALVDELFSKLAVMTEDPYMREAVAKYALREMSWHSIGTLEVSQYDIANHLQLMSEVIRDHKEK